MNLYVPRLLDLVVPVTAFHKGAGYCGYTVRHSLETLAEALKDPVANYIRAVWDPTKQNDMKGLVGYIWGTLEKDHVFANQFWSSSSEAATLLFSGLEEWAKANGAYEIRGNTGRLGCLKAWKKRFGLEPVYVHVRKRL